MSAGATRRSTFRATRRAICGVVGAVLLLAGCGVTTDSTPRDVPVNLRRELLASRANTPGASVGSARIYLRTPGRGGTSVLRAVPRDVEELPSTLLGALFSGPNDDEVRQELTSAIPRDAHLLTSRQSGGVLTLDVSDALRELTGSALLEATAQIVLTATEIPGVQAVRILLAGEVHEWPDGSGALVSRPLTKYDYPGFVESTQPDFPPVPTPTTP